MTDDREFGIVANITETDSIFRLGAKAWLLSGWAGGGFERLQISAITRGGDYREKWIPTTRLDNFRAAWMPARLRREAGYFCAKSKGDAAAQASELQALADRRREAHPNRLVGNRAADGGK